MLKLPDAVIDSPPIHSCWNPLPLRSVRPSLLDLRFTGDACVVDHRDGTASLRLDNYRLARINTVSFDLPSLNHLLLQLRYWQMRRRPQRQRRARDH